jgi:hypothetical protein
LSRTETLTKGDDFYIVNDCKGDQQILAMSYTVKEGTNPKFTVKISHKDYPDYFKTTGSDKLTVYDNGKDSCTLSPSNKKAADWSDPDAEPVVAPLIEAYTGSVTLWGQTAATLQNNITISDGTIAGTLNYIADYTSAGFAAADHHFIVLHATDSEVSQIYVDDPATGILDEDKIAVLRIQNNTQTVHVVK